MDALYVALIALFFAATALLVRFIGSLGGSK
jgi:hypothetical protein